ncbi:MAG: amino acid--tRNA ligase-related protein [Deltaproteobacteria bacterium]|nr:amino acid--tRNA ligase-related protein [Deltaproteobacteria bacterium]
MTHEHHGRVWNLSETSLTVGDALSRVEIQCAANLLADVLVGDLVRVQVSLRKERLVAHEITRVFRPTRSAGARGTETARLTLHRRAEHLVARAQVLSRVRQWFARQRFTEVETPTIAVCPGLDLHLTAYEAIDTSSAKSLGYMITSPEYHMKRLVVGGLSQCFQFARCFRSGDLGSRHEPEFTMLEWYRAWGTLDALVEDTMGVLLAACDRTTLRARDGHTLALSEGHERLTVREAFARFASEITDPIGLAERDEHEYFRILGEKIEPQLGRTRPTFLTHFAARHASLSQLDPEDRSVCLRAELYVDGQELSNGFVELTDPVEQRARLVRDQQDRAQRGLPEYPIDEDFLRALEEGMPPSVGNAMGLDRLVALALELRDLREVLAFSQRDHESVSLDR